MRILIVSWAWPPIGRIGSMRPLGMAREWSELGEEVHVVTGPGDRGGEYTPDLCARADASRAIVHRAEAPGLPPPTDLRPAFESSPKDLVSKRRVSRLHQILSQWRNFPDQQRSWIEPAVRLCLQRHSSTPFDVVWSTSPPESAHYVARALVLKGVPWVADFRDQWSDYLLARWDPVSGRIIDRVTRRVLSPAAALTAATEGVAQSIRRASGKVVACVRNGFDPVELDKKRARSRCLGYFGRIDPTMQHPERLWNPLRILKARGRPWTVEFFVSPGGGGGANVRPPEDLRELVRVSPPLPHQDALRAMQTMTALLVLAWETRGGETSVAGKLYEYVGSGRAVLVCAPQGSEARTLVEATGTGLGAWSDEEIVESLFRLESFTVDPHGREGLTRRRSAEQLLALFAEACASSGGDH